MAFGPPPLALCWPGCAATPRAESGKAIGKFLAQRPATPAPALANTLIISSRCPPGRNGAHTESEA